MNALATPTKGILLAEELTKKLGQGVVPLAKYLCPDQWLDEATLPVIQQACLWSLIEQIKLRDDYIAKCMKDLGVPDLVEHEVDFDILMEAGTELFCETMVMKNNG